MQGDCHLQIRRSAEVDLDAEGAVTTVVHLHRRHLARGQRRIRCRLDVRRRMETASVQIVAEAVDQAGGDRVRLAHEVGQRLGRQHDP